MIDYEIRAELVVTAKVTVQADNVKDAMIQADARPYDNWELDDTDEYVIKDFLSATPTPD